MSSSQVMDGSSALEQCLDISLASSQSFTMEEKSGLANSSFENSPSLDREKFLKYSARSRDEFWDALSSNYDYLMDDGLIATCREASSDLSLDDEREIPEACFWSFTQFIEQFKWLHDLLHNIQVAKEGGSDSSGTKIIEDKQKVAYLCKLFNDQAQRLSKRYPDMRDEVHRHLNRLNNKWKAVEQSINPNIVKSPSKDKVFHEISLRMRNLRKWLRDIEGRLSPINPTANWTLENLERKYKETDNSKKKMCSSKKNTLSGA